MAGEIVLRPAAPVSAAPPPGLETEFLAKAFLAGYDGRTRESYATDLRQYFTWCQTVPLNPLDAKRAHVQVYARILTEQLQRSKATVARKLSAITGFYGYAVTEGELERSPAAHVRRPKVADESPRFGLDRDEFAGLLAIANTDGPVSHALLCLLGLNGLRVSAACNATVGDLSVDRGHQLLTITLKGGKRQAVPLAPRTAAAIAALPSLTSPRGVDFQPPAGDVNPDHGQDSRATSPAAAGQLLLGIDRFAAWRLVRRLAHQAGITKPISPHSLRHTFVTLALDAGVELRDVQDAAGHADPRTTRRYDRNRYALERAATYRVAAFIDED
jgi:integrase/recombinase XerD